MSSKIHSNTAPVEAKKPPFAVFLATTTLVFFCALSAADSVGFVPYYIDGTAPTVSAPHDSTLALSHLPELGEEVSSASSVTSTTLPTRIRIGAIDLDLPVQNPATRDLAALDTILQKGPARYVDSAHLGESGNVLIFAHSSHLPIVHNQMYRAFNKIPDLKTGDTITLTGDDGKEYTYRTLSVVKADATDAAIDLSRTQGTRLTLVTCDTLTSKSARFVLTAELVR